jgi:hypothetical protein
MADAALAKNLTVQWCYAAPTDVLASLEMPAVTNYRVSNDFCYGRSWDIGKHPFRPHTHPFRPHLWSVGGGPGGGGGAGGLAYRVASNNIFGAGPVLSPLVNR